MFVSIIVMETLGYAVNIYQYIIIIIIPILCSYEVALLYAESKSLAGNILQQMNCSVLQLWPIVNSFL